MRKQIAASMLLASVSLSLAGAEEVDARPEKSELVRECVLEASRGHPPREPASEVRQHEGHMTSLCREWLSVSGGRRDDLLNRCLAESHFAWHSVGREAKSALSHIARHQRLCRQLWSI